MNVAITGNNKPSKNHFLGSRPIRFAKREVIKGTLNKNKTPKLINATAPIL